jgi:hypothetical protein
MLRLDYISCILTVLSTFIVGKKLWQGWFFAGEHPDYGTQLFSLGALASGTA